MSRVFFPTTSLNRWGVRVTGSQGPALGAVSRFYQEPTPRAAQNPTGPMLGGLNLVAREFVGDGITVPAVGPVQRFLPQPVYVGPITYVPPPPPPQLPYTPPPTPPSAPAPISSSGGGGAVAPAPAPAPAPSSPFVPVSAQVSPTPVVSAPPAPAAIPLSVSSGGGTLTPAVASGTNITVAAQPSMLDSAASWLGGSTALFGANVPNVLIAAVVVLGFAAFTGGKKR